MSRVQLTGPAWGDNTGKIVEVEGPLGSETFLRILDGQGRDGFRVCIIPGCPDCGFHGELVEDYQEGGKPDATNPSYYHFPGGVEVIQISEHLSANGAQAFQYIARATRTDGKVKGDPLEDLEKASWFIEREKARLGAAQ